MGCKRHDIQCYADELTLEVFRTSIEGLVVHFRKVSSSDQMRNIIRLRLAGGV